MFTPVGLAQFLVKEYFRSIFSYTGIGPRSRKVRKNLGAAFANALQKQALSLDRSSSSYLGHYGYLYTDAEADVFFHVKTEERLSVSHKTLEGGAS